MTTQADKGECSEAPMSQSEMEALCFRNLLNNPDERIYFKDRASRFLLVSQGWANAVTPGHAPEEFVGKTDFDIFTELHAADAFEDEQRIMRTGEPIVGKHERETYEDRPDQWVATTKQPLYDRDGRVVGTFGISRDVTAQVKAEEALAYQALHDPLTGLANRVSLMDRISRALVALERRPGRLAVLFIDLDNFKAINDAMGHDTGDKVLVEVSRRLCRIARRVDTVARFGGDEFVVLCSDIGTTRTPGSSPTALSARSANHSSTQDATSASPAASASWSLPTRRRTRASSCETRTWRCTGPKSSAATVSRCSCLRSGAPWRPWGPRWSCAGR